LHRSIASRAAGIAFPAGCVGSRRRAIASGSIRFALPSNRMAEVKVDLPDPLGPAITASVGILLQRRGNLAENFKMGLARRSRSKANFKPRSVWQLLYVAAIIIHKDNRMTRRKGLLTCPQTGCYGSLREFVRENLGRRHSSIIAQLRRVEERRPSAAWRSDPSPKSSTPRHQEAAPCGK
jgi:hypothetical protein